MTLTTKRSLPLLQLRQDFVTARTDFNDQFVAHLKASISDDIDINGFEFFEKFRNNFIVSKNLSNAFTEREIKVLNRQLKNDAADLFPAENTHSKAARHHRSLMEENRFQRDYQTLSKAYEDGKKLIKENKKGKFKAGELIEAAWVEILDEYFGQQFEIHRNKEIKTSKDGVNLPEFDIVLTKRDTTHKTPAIADYLLAENVVAAFEVKRTIIKSHLTREHEDAIDIFQKRGLALQSALRPKNLEEKLRFTPFQMLEGKVFYGLLGADIEDSALDVLMSDKFYLRTADPFQAAQVVYSPGKVLYKKSMEVKDTVSQFALAKHLVALEPNPIDRSLSSFGYFIKSMREFFIAQGHIPKENTNEYLKDYKQFGLLEGEKSGTKMDGTTGKFEAPVFNDLLNYLRDRPSRATLGTEGEIANRPQLQIMKNWFISSVPQVSFEVKSMLKHRIDREIRLAKEMDLDYSPLPAGVSPYDSSFDRYFESLFAD